MRSSFVSTMAVSALCLATLVGFGGATIKERRD